MPLVSDGERLTGAYALGPEAGDWLQQATVAIRAHVPLEVMEGWLHAVARLNPMTYVLELAREGFLGDVTWADTWPGALALAGFIFVLGAFAFRGLQRLTP